MQRLFAIALVVACDSSPPPSPQQRRPSAPCGEVAAHELLILALSPDHKAQITAVCHDDRWSIDVRRCILVATTRDALDACHAMLAPKQRDDYRAELDEIIGSGSSRRSPERSPD